MLVVVQPRAAAKPPTVGPLTVGPPLKCAAMQWRGSQWEEVEKPVAAQVAAQPRTAARLPMGGPPSMRAAMPAPVAALART